MSIVVNGDGTADETIVIRKPVLEWKLELQSINAKLETVRVAIDRLQAQRDRLQARKLELREIQDLP